MSQTYRFDVVTAFSASSLNISAEDFKTRNPNEFYSGGDLAWMMVSSWLVLLMVPGLGLFYSGILERCSAISMMWLSMMTTALVGVQWFLWGYTITSSGSGRIWGGADSLVFHGDLTIPWGNKAGTKIPQLSYAFYQGMFACFTAAVVSSAVIRKGRPLHFLVFIFLWSTFVYDPIAHSTWNPDALNGPYKPHNIINVVLGTAFLWIGWFGFNGGSALGANLRAVTACISTHLAACAGAVTGSLLEYIAASRRDVDTSKFSVVGFCNGAVAGLVAITPAAGYVPYWSAPNFGIAGSFFVALFQDISVAYFDTNEISVVHSVAGWVEMLFSAGLARADVAALDGYTVMSITSGNNLGFK
ncbi:ammonium transporter AmtB-like domain-containing protein [Cadophora sp. MPI-SDFR-AT-0126]|nr:ammonium transporter AmtB-like domain-containing protein [Leotiomycetes sp. MPI-SDFR-AT-0126]